MALDVDNRRDKVLASTSAATGCPCMLVGRRGASQWRHGDFVRAARRRLRDDARNKRRDYAEMA